VFLCDSILEKHAQILVLVRNLESTSETGTFANEKLKLLIDKVGQFRPEFTAARFFSLNKSTLFGILYNLVTFFLVIIQYKFKL
jgi:gustatory receptor